MRELDNAEIAVYAWNGPELLGTVYAIVLVDRSNHKVKEICNDIAWLYHRFYLSRFNIKQTIFEHRLGIESVGYD